MGRECNHWVHVRCAKISDQEKESVKEKEDIERLIYFCLEKCNMDRG